MRDNVNGRTLQPENRKVLTCPIDLITLNTSTIHEKIEADVTLNEVQNTRILNISVDQNNFDLCTEKKIWTLQRSM